MDTWLEEDLVDYLLPDHGTRPDYLRRRPERGGESRHIWPSMMPRGQPGEAYLATAEELYASGADGFCIWDAERRHPRMSEWAIVRRLSHRFRSKKLHRLAGEIFRKVPLRTNRGVSMVESYRDG